MDCRDFLPIPLNCVLMRSNFCRVYVSQEVNVLLHGLSVLICAGNIRCFRGQTWVNCLFRVQFERSARSAKATPSGGQRRANIVWNISLGMLQRYRYHVNILIGRTQAHYSPSDLFTPRSKKCIPILQGAQDSQIFNTYDTAG